MAHGGVPASVEATEYLFHHVVLPSKLPQSDDYDASHERYLIDATLQALQDMKRSVHHEHADAVATAIKMIQNLRNSRDSHGDISELQLEALLFKLSRDQHSGSLPLQIKVQNAGVLISRRSESLVFEFFELSPTNTATMGAKGRLKRTFPASAVEVSTGEMDQKDLRHSVANTIAKMTTQAAPGFQPQVRKHGAMMNEDRDTTDPGIVTDLLKNTIAALGNTTDVVQILKHTREEVLWDQCKHPWRRSSLWLLIRVSLQLHFNRQKSNLDTPNMLFKSFMLSMLSHTLGLAKLHWRTLGSDPIYAILAKMIRRMKKLEALEQPASKTIVEMEHVRAAMDSAHNFIATRWQVASEDHDPDIDTALVAELQPYHDLNLNLPDLDAFLLLVASRQRSQTDSSFNDRSENIYYSAEDFPGTNLTDGVYTPFRLAAVERWVELHLQSWITNNSGDEATCEKIRRLIEGYHSVARNVYAQVPVNLSIMYLTILELWVACDVSACQLYPLLRDYDHTLRIDAVHCLCLPFKSDLLRLHRVEQHVRERRDAAKRGAPSIFDDFGHSSAFAVKYFNASPELQGLLSQIEDDAAQQRQQKCDELREKKCQYNNLMDRYNTEECDYREVIVDHYHGYTESRHQNNCVRCNCKNKASALDIDIYEWPVSSNQYIAKATIFELKVPEAFSHWRDATVYVAFDTLSSRYESRKSPSNSYTLDRHHGIRHMLSRRNHGQRIIPLSDIKPHTGTHRKKQKAIINLKEKDVCLDNALAYAYYDNSGHCWSGNLSLTEEVAQKCTYQLPDRSSKLQTLLFRPPSCPEGTLPNEIVANVSECPVHFSIDEYKAFGSISFGQKLVWLNILTQLAMPIVDFAKAETQCLIMQAIHQTGPSDHKHRVLRSHRALADPSFCITMLEQLDVALQRVAANWESFRTFVSFAEIARRILSLTDSRDVEQRSLKLLSKMRNIAMTWIQRLKTGVELSKDDEQRDGLHSRMTEIALACIVTFNVDDEFIDVIFEQPSTISALLRCAIIVQENSTSVTAKSTESMHLYRAMLQSWKSLMYRLLPKLREKIVNDGTELNDAVRANWAAFQPASGDGWSPLIAQRNHWLCIKSGLLVHFNLLTAELLVNGLPLTRLPSEFLRHPLYTALFQKSAIEVVPTDEPGMNFSAKSTYYGYKLSFGMRKKDMLVVAATDTDRFDLLPSRLFLNLLPDAFEKNFIHWYDHKKDEVVFRPRDHPWSSDDPTVEWHLKREGVTWRLVNGTNALINIDSNSARTVSRILGALESKKHCHLIFNSVSKTIDIELPRLRLEFSIKRGDDRVYSRQYREMIIDNDQKIGTLVGLSSKLVLRHTSQVERRMILIPVPRTFGPESGFITYAKNLRSHHIHVSVNKDHATQVYAYSLDLTLGRVLSDSGDLQSRLFLSYLHAITSHCLPDFLTGYTGTESALNILQSAAVRSFAALTGDNVALLTQIASLSPSRSFYPRHEKVMQQIQWDNDLSFFSQHYHFFTSVKEILDQAMQMKLFHDSPNPFEPQPDTMERFTSKNTYLDQRDAIRSAVFRTAGFGADSFTIDQDIEYASRDRPVQSARGKRAFLAAKMILRDQFALYAGVPDLEGILRGTHFRNAIMKGFELDGGVLGLKELRYDIQWLDEPSTLLPSFWCNLYHSLTTSPKTYSKYDIMTWLSTMSYSSSADMNVVQALASFYRVRMFSTIQIPAIHQFDLSRGDQFNSDKIYTIAHSACRPLESCPEIQIKKETGETYKQYKKRRTTKFTDNKNAAVTAFVAAIRVQWPCTEPSMPTSSNITTYLMATTAHASVTNAFQAWSNNCRFYEYLHKVSTAVAQQNVMPIQNPNYALGTFARNKQAFVFPTSSTFDVPAPILLHNSLLQRASFLLARPSEPITIGSKTPQSEEHEIYLRLKHLCQVLDTCANAQCEKDYVENLRISTTAFQQHQASNQMQNFVLNGAEELLQDFLDESQEYLDALQNALRRAVVGEGDSSKTLGFRVQTSDRITPAFWLSCLNRDRFDSLPQAWKDAVIEFGLAVARVQRAQRLFALSKKPMELAEELRHVGHTNWNPSELPEILLLEAESGIAVREVQAAIAEQMIAPPSSKNTVMQLNMGEGKSSVIVPIVAAVLSDTQKLVRAIVAKPQSKQMLQMLVSRLGGLLNRRIYHMPFSRALKLTAKDAKIIRDIYEDCMRNRGVLLVQPEHILSFKLMGIECLHADENETARSLLDTQQFFDNFSRDIIDESDENFSVKFELIYTMGSQRSIELAPERWLMIQEILEILSRVASKVKAKLPLSIEVEDCFEGQFPRVRILREDAGDELSTMLAKHIVRNGISGLPIGNQPPDTQAAILKFISTYELTSEDISKVENSKFWTDSTKLPLLLCRGLLANGVFRFVLSKRWRVNYGLDANRRPETDLAVPYRSKDSPSPRSEFSHPDVVILLTQLSHYYNGLSDEVLFESLEHLMKSDQSTILYDEIVRTASINLPMAFRHLSGVSLKDRVQCAKEIFPRIRHSKAAVDYFLSHLVYPREMKEFESKLSASGWDLGQVKANPTTGFSGTCDTQHTLPLSVSHLDLPTQSHTNALVLGYLLQQDENPVELLPPRTNLSNAENLLQTVQSIRGTPVRVILDVGAQVLDRNNEEVAKLWLQMSDSDVQAVVFFTDDVLSVLDRAGRIESLQTSPFAKQLDVCLIYLDEAHTRGTDLRLPRHYRAALTLGAALTKDRLVQAAMRMRQLGKGQSVVFVVSEEIQTQIHERTGKPRGASISVEDVLSWSIGQTWRDLAKSMPLWAVQGHRYETHKHLINGASTTKAQAEAFLEDEAQSLETRYKPRSHENTSSLWDMSNANIAQIVSRCKDFEAMDFSSATLHEEQERELAPEIEEQRQVERPLKMHPEKHQLHPDLQHLARTGKMPDENSKAFRHAFKTLQSTSAANFPGLSDFPKDILVTSDFARTVQIPAGSSADTFIADSYQRPIQWILSVYKNEKDFAVDKLIILSPYEANLIFKYVKKHAKVTLHLFAPRSNASFEPLDRLELYNVGRTFYATSISRSLTMQLNLFAGSLYLRSYAEYIELCKFLGLLTTKLKDGQQVQADGFMDPPTGMWGLKISPVPLLRVLLMKIRREGEGIEKTHLGKLLNGVRLGETDFED